MSFWEGFIEGITKNLGEMIGAGFVAAFIGAGYWIKKILDSRKQKSEQIIIEETKHYTTLEKIEHAADTGDSWVQYLLGEKYEHEQNYTLAVLYYRKSAEQGVPAAQYNLGVMYEHGRGVNKIIAEARKWYHKAADQNYQDAIEALKRLGNNIPELEDKKEDIIKPKPKIDITLKIEPEVKDVKTQEKIDEQKYSPKVNDLIKSARGGNAEAQVKLGTMFTTGLGGLPCDYTQSVYWYKKAAEQGNSDGQYWLGVMLEQGNGTPRNINEARRYYQKAAAQGHSVAKKVLKRLQ